MNNYITIAKNVPLTFRLRAQYIMIDGNGEIIIVVSQFGPDQQIPKLTIDYLENLCCDFYFGGKYRPNAIADILMLNNIIGLADYNDFYSALQKNTAEGNITIIHSELFQ